ncbi:phosphoribosylamine--glycine ligase [bacterium]|nr:phosphoribosylamine--glycine ligase [bacterium]
MNILVIGNGGREHALIWKIAQSPYVERIFCAPGNGGIAELATCVQIDVTDLKGLTQFAVREKIDLTVAGPELPLTLGVVDAFRREGLVVFGPRRDAAILEGSKTFTKDFLAKYNIPSAAYRNFDDPEEAVRYIHDTPPPYVLKADGLAAGKGVIICRNRNEAFQGIDDIMKTRKFGEAGKRLVIEEFMTGEEASILAVTDGERFVTLPPAQDHKAVFEGDKGPNTGGMGAYAPAPVVDERLLEQIKTTIIQPTIDGMKAEDRLYQGVLYAGLMITAEGPKVVEFNCRFGDPEIQAILPLMKTDIVDLMMEVADGKLKPLEPEISHDSCICVVMASGGYPGSYQKDKVILGLEDVRDQDVMVFHAGTKRSGDQTVTSGGRVLGVTATGRTFLQAREKAYQAVGKITFDGAYYRRDIGHRALKLRSEG